MPRILSPLSVAFVGLFLLASVVHAEELPAPPPRPTLMDLEEIHGVVDVYRNDRKPQDYSPRAKRPQAAPEGELITERYPDRAVKLQRYVVQDAERNYVNHGPWTMMDPQGRVLAQGEYRNGKRHGSWMRVMQEFGAVDPQFKAPFVSHAEFNDGQLDGVWKVTDAQQRIVGSWEFADGELSGTSTTWYPNGQQRREMKFKKGVPDGEATAWKASGQVWGKEFFRDGKQLVPVVTWHDRDQKESEGWLLRTNFTIAAKVDWWNGQLEIIRNETEGEDVKIGEWEEWYANGSQKFSGSYDHGDPTGVHTFWHENGQKMLVGSYRAGVADGRWTQWHPTGMKQEEGTYLAGVKSGSWTTWEESGQVVSVQDMTGAEIASDEDDPISHNVSHITPPQ